MEIKQIFEDKKRFLVLLLLADEQENMIDKYLDRGDLFALYDDDLRSLCVVTDEGDGVFELKSLATYPRYQKRGYARKLIEHVAAHYKGKGKILMVGTGDTPVILPFYEQCGFAYSHKLKNFFVDNYDKPIFEDEVQLIDMVYLRMEL